MATNAEAPPEIDEATARKAANRFDIRRIIGGVFLVYGAILTVVWIVGSDEVKNKAAGINVNLWTGLAMLVVGAMMIAWALMRPAEPDAPRERRSALDAAAYARRRVERRERRAVGGRVQRRQHPDLARERRPVVVDDVLGHAAVRVEPHDVAAGQVDAPAGCLDAAPRRPRVRPGPAPANRRGALVA